MYNQDPEERKPLISCICLTYNRPGYLQKSIRLFLDQTYQNKELIIIYRADDIKTKEMLHLIDDPGIYYYEALTAEQVTIGDLRNYAIGKSSGDYFCQWDDDDWCHNERLEMQMNTIFETKKSACILAYWMFYDVQSKKSYLSLPHMWAGSILCKKNILTKEVKYPSKSKGEDSDFLGILYSLNCVAPLIKPYLYIYLFHHANTMNHAHFEKFFAQSQPMNDYTNDLVHHIINGEYSSAEASVLISDPSVTENFNYFYGFGRKKKSRLKAFQDYIFRRNF